MFSGCGVGVEPRTPQNLTRITVLGFRLPALGARLLNFIRAESQAGSRSPRDAWFNLAVYRGVRQLTGRYGRFRLWPFGSRSRLWLSAFRFWVLSPPGSSSAVRRQSQKSEPNFWAKDLEPSA